LVEPIWGRGAELLLRVDADERRRPRRVVGLAVAEHHAVERGLPGRRRCALLLLLPGPLTVVSSGPTPVHATSKETW